MCWWGCEGGGLNVHNPGHKGGVRHVNGDLSTRSDACILEWVVVDFRNESPNRVKLHRIAKVMVCDAHRTAQIVCLIPSKALH